MQNVWLQNVKLHYSKNVFDIVQFGSSVIDGKEARDIDIAVIFTQLSIKEQLNETQELKKQLTQFTDKLIHVTPFHLYSLLNESNFAREGILLYGVSLLNGKRFAERLGLRPLIQIQYSLKKLSKKHKIQFNYLLSGRGGNYGLLRKYGGSLLAPGIITIHPEHELVFLREMQALHPVLTVTKIFVSVP